MDHDGYRWTGRTDWPMPHRILDRATEAVALRVVTSNLPAAIAAFSIPFPNREDMA